MNREGAIAGMLVGLIFTFTYIVLNAVEKNGFIIADIKPTGIGTIGMILHFVVALVCATVARRKRFSKWLKTSVFPVVRVQHTLTKRCCQQGSSDLCISMEGVSDDTPLVVVKEAYGYACSGFECSAFNLLNHRFKEHRSASGIF